MKIDEYTYDKTKRLFPCKTVDATFECLDLFCDYLFIATGELHKNGEECRKRHEAKLMAQMIFMKSLHLGQVLGCVSYTGSNGVGIPPLIDPGVVAIIARNIYETCAFF